MIHPIQDYLGSFTFVMNKFPTEETQESFKHKLFDYANVRLKTEESA